MNSAQHPINGSDQFNCPGVCAPEDQNLVLIEENGGGNENGNTNGDDNRNGRGSRKKVEPDDEDKDEEMENVVDGEVAGSSDESGRGSGTESGSGSGTTSRGTSAEPKQIPGASSSFEPIAGPSGINFGASTSGTNLIPSSFEDEEEGKRPRKKVRAKVIDYGDYEFDDEEFGYAYGSYDLNFGIDDPNNNNEYGLSQALFNKPLGRYGSQYPFKASEPASGISEADWNEAGPSGINTRPGPSAIKSRPSYSDLSSASNPPSASDQVISTSSSGGCSTAAQAASQPSDSDLSSSCSHHSLVDRYTHMNISGCEDQTDEECAFEESDDPFEDD